jgi:hypothetical protein
MLRSADIAAVLSYARPTASVDLRADARPACDRLLALADRYRWALWGVALAFYLAAFNGQWRVQPDAALYLSIGRNLAQGHGYTYLGHTNRLAYPGWPVMIAAAFKLFGSRSLVPVHVLLQLVTLGTLAATYRLFLLHSGRPTAVLVTFGTALTKAFFVYTLELWTDLPFAMAAMAMLAGYEGTLARRATGQPARRSRWYDWALLVGGLALAVAIRPTGWPLMMALVLAIGVDAVRGRVRPAKLVAVVAGVAAVTVVCGVVLWRAHGEMLGGYEHYLLHRVAGGTAGPGGAATDQPLAQNVYALFAWAASDVLFQVRFGFTANAMLSGLVLGLGLGLYRVRALWGLWFTLLLATILLMVQETLDRYFLPVLPLLVSAWWSAIVWVDRQPTRSRSRRRLLDGACLFLLGAGAIVNVCKVGGLIGQQRSRPFLATYDQGCYQPVPALSAAIGRRVGPDDLVLIKPPYGRVAAYLSDRDVVNANELGPDQLVGRRVYVVEPADAKIRKVLADSGLAIGPLVYAVPAPPGVAVKAEKLSLHTTVRR